MNISPIVKIPAEEQATNALREFIISGQIPQGTRITEAVLSEKLNLSRSTVRTALHLLTREGLVRLKPYSGWMITMLTEKDIWELCTLRSAIERLGARLAAEFIDSDNNSEKLQLAFKHFTQTCASNDYATIAESDLGLHEAIIEISGNQRLQEQYDLIKRQTLLFIRSSNDLIPDSGEILNQHKPIVEAILSGDIELAGRLSEEHNIEEGKKLISSIAL
ncbi:TPA: GntR family transcriptional regulator [Salmonella enterica subsp. enterica serovar Newport]|nr:GntR family transcriptional regulator [Salmonella enterica]EEK2864606.1 GntR family transcriptional regulator [Salmonella enterica]EEK2973686.1 GntR family transcriptional regulator [Salmonella enterica]EMD2586614.1 GntR family transcriptional regulator [Salmonella enterica]